MAANRKEAAADQAMWERIRPLVPPHPPQPKGGRPWVPDEPCFHGIVYQLRNAIRWNDMPQEFPSGTTCWRRFNDWTNLGIWPAVHRIILEELEAAGKLDLSELALDATFAEARKRGDCLGPTKCGVGNKIELLIDAHGIPLGVAVDAANVAETAMGLAVLAMALVTLPGDAGAPTPVLCDRAYDCDWLREALAKQGLVLVAKHRSNRVRKATSDGRRERRLSRRWKIERSNAWLHSDRRALTRYEKTVKRFEGFVSLACAVMALGKVMT